LLLVPCFAMNPMNTLSATASFYVKTGDGTYTPTEATIGPWSADLQHGGPPCALLTHALMQHAPRAGMQLARITLEFFGTVPLTPCEIRVETVRAGKRIELLKASYVSQGKTCMLAHAWRLESAPGVAQAVPEPFGLPTFPAQQPQGFFPGVVYFPYGHAMEWRFVQGGFDTLGPATVWARSRIALVDNAPLQPLENLMLMIDSANGVSAELDIRRWSFVPVDLSIGLVRQPEGAWQGMAARTAVQSHGIGQTTTTAFDETGSLGHSLHTLFVRPR
jgi:hypothetical protein